MKIGERIREFRKAARLTQGQLATRVGVSAPAVTQWEKGTTDPEYANIAKIADVLGLKVSDLTSDGPIIITTTAATEAYDLEDMVSVRPAPDVPPLPHPASMAKDIKVLGTAECGPNGTFELNTGDVIDFVRRPPGLIGNRTVFAIYANGDSMEPMFWPGDLVYVDPKRPPMPGRAVVVEMHPPHEQEHPRALLKILVRRNGDSVELRQLNPDKPTTVPNSKIKGIYRVLTLAELMGI
jgi:phage repressor protein C with HTH and peptisase S24 domain